jgi:putative restriction endonuclease
MSNLVADRAGQSQAASKRPESDGAWFPSHARLWEICPRVRGFVAPTDHGWYQFLLARQEIGEVNFWRPGAGGFAALRPGEPFFFKLKAPNNAIGGFGLFARFARLPVWRAWDVFGQANGTSDEYELLARDHRLGRERLVEGLNRIIGCIAVSEPVFFTPDEWVATPADWPASKSIRRSVLSASLA